MIESEIQKALGDEIQKALGDIGIKEGEKFDPSMLRLRLVEPSFTCEIIEPERRVVVTYEQLFKLERVANPKDL